MHAPLTEREKEIVARACGPVSDLPDDVQRRLEGYAKQIDKAKRSIVADGFKIGDLLKQAQGELANHGDGTFIAWVQSRCGFGKSTAYKYLSISESFAPEVRPVAGQTCTLEALCLLARDTTPEDAITDAIEAAERGERITLKKAKEIVAGHTPEPEAEEPSDLDFPDACELLEKALVRVAKRWPSHAMASLADSLETLAAEIREHGTLWQLKEVSGDC